MNLKSPFKNKSGFTLLEVMITIGILAMIAFLLSKSQIQTMRLRQKLSQEGDFFSEIHIGVGLIRKDIAGIYNPKILMIEAQTDTKTGNPKPPSKEDMEAMMGSRTDTDFWGDPIDETALRPTQFIGDGTTMKFVTSTNERIYRNSKESEFIKVSYELRDDNEDKDSKVLVKVVDVDVFNTETDDNDHKRTYRVLTGLKTLEFRYYKKDKEKWESKWDTTQSDTKGIFPDLIELKFSSQGPEKASYDGLYTFKPELPVNGLLSSF